MITKNNKNYAINEVSYFSITFAAPAYHGSYKMLVDFTAGQHIGCWILDLTF